MREAQLLRGKHRTKGDPLPVGQITEILLDIRGEYPELF